MKKIEIVFVALIAFACLIAFSCSKKRIIKSEDFFASIPENPVSGQNIGKLKASSQKGVITYQLNSESVEGAITLDQSTGNITVNDESLFNYEYRTSINAEVTAVNGTKSSIIKVTIAITDVEETPAVIGEFRDGGVVFWIDPIDNSKGMVCSIRDFTCATWGCWDIMNPQVINGADNTEVGGGKQNTSDMEAANCELENTASKVCVNLTEAGFNDWFLPSRDEMWSIYIEKSKINLASSNNGGTNLREDAYYWSSTEIDASNAYDMIFDTGISGVSLKINGFLIRAARYF